MGALFAERSSASRDPRVALLSIGEEKGKGDARIQRATELLDASDLRFTGNVEGKDLVHHMADVVVCDAVIGNVTIKFFEGLSTFIFDLSAREFRRPPLGPLAYAPHAPGDRSDPERSSTTRSSAARRSSGVRGTVIITHGRAKRRMVATRVEVGPRPRRARIPEPIAETFAAAAVAAVEAATAAEPPRATTRPSGRRRPPSDRSEPAARDGVSPSPGSSPR